jgi:hypothetical protein
MTRSASAWGTSAQHLISSGVDVALYGSTPGVVLSPSIASPSPDLAYSFEANWFMGFVLNTQFTETFEFSLNDGATWLTWAPASRTVLHTSQASIAASTGRIIGAQLGIEQGTPSLRFRYNMLAPTASYMLEPVRWALLSEFLP